MFKRKINTCKLCNGEVISQHGRPRIWCSMKCKNLYNNSKRKSTKRTKQIECKTCGSLSLNQYCSRLCYPNSKMKGSIWYKIYRFEKLTKELKILTKELENIDLNYIKKNNV
jgi:hypothetical protein